MTNENKMTLPNKIKIGNVTFQEEDILVLEEAIRKLKEQRKKRRKKEND